MNQHTMCAVEECDRKSSSRGYCAKHYQQFMRTGDPRPTRTVAPRKNARQDDALCAVDDCTDTVHTGGYCRAHYRRSQRHGDPIAGGPSQKSAIDHADGDRTCNTCGIKKPIDEYRRGRRYKRGRRPRCIACGDAWRLAHQAEHKERYDDEFRTREHLRRARIAGKETDAGVTRQALRGIHGDDCIYCGITMDFTTRGRIKTKDRATVEHILPIARGGSHTWANTALACSSCNFIKGNKTVEEFADYLAVTKNMDDNWQLSA